MAPKQPLDILLRDGMLYDMAEEGLWYDTPMDLAHWASARPSRPRARHVAWVAVALVASLAVLLFA